MKKVSDYGKLQRKIRNEAKISIRLLSELSGVSHSYLSQVENGTRDRPSPDIIGKISSALNYDYYAMLRSAGYMEAEANENLNKSNSNETIDTYHKPSSILKRIPRSYKEEFINEEKIVPKDFFEKTDEEVDENFQELFYQFETVGNWLKAFRLSENKSLEDLSRITKIPIQDLKSFENDSVTPKDNVIPAYDQLKLIGDAYSMDDLNKWFSTHTNVIIDTKNIEAFGQPMYMDFMDKVKISFEVPASEVLEAYNRNFHLSRDIPAEEAKQRFLYLENLLTMDENIYLNKKILTPFEKAKALEILKIVFQKESEDTSE